MIEKPRGRSLSIIFRNNTQKIPTIDKKVNNNEIGMNIRIGFVEKDANPIKPNFKDFLTLILLLPTFRISLSYAIPFSLNPNDEITPLK